MKLKDGDLVVTAWAEHVSGPGWSNHLVWVLVRERGGKLREEAFQPDEQSGDMMVLFGVCAAAAKSLTAEVKRVLVEKR